MAVDDKQSKPLVVKPGRWIGNSRVLLITAILSAAFATAIIVVTVVAPIASSPSINPEKKQLARGAREEFEAPSDYVLTAYSTMPGENANGVTKACIGYCPTPGIGDRLKSGLRTAIAYLETDGGRNFTLAICAIVSALAAILTLRLKRAESALAREQSETEDAPPPFRPQPQ